MLFKNITSVVMGLVLSLAMFITFPSLADHNHPQPSKKEIRLEAKLLKEKGKRLQQEGREMLKDVRTTKAHSGNRKVARKLRKEARYLVKVGKNMEQQGRLLRKGKISLYSIKDC